MIHEWRSYRLKPGAGPAYLALLADRGLPLVTRYLPLMGFWLTETGGLNALHHLWSYASWAEREAARAALAQDEGWTRGFVPEAFALVEEQQNRLLRLTRSSPGFDAALAARRRAHPARAPGAPLFAAPCAGALFGATAAEGVEGAVADFAPLSGAGVDPLTLLPRMDDPVPAAAPATERHMVLRPLAFSPL